MKAHEDMFTMYVDVVGNLVDALGDAEAMMATHLECIKTEHAGVGGSELKRMLAILRKLTIASSNAEEAFNAAKYPKDIQGAIECIEDALDSLNDIREALEEAKDALSH